MTDSARSLCGTDVKRHELTCSQVEGTEAYRQASSLSNEDKGSRDQLRVATGLEAGSPSIDVAGRVVRGAEFPDSGNLDLAEDLSVRRRRTAN